MECSICGISDKMRDVSQALSGTGIVFACDKCAKTESLILMKKPKIVEETRESVYQRMARLAGVKAKVEEERPKLKSQEKSLKELVNKNYEKKIASQIVLKKRPDLADNFHWILMRVRRVKGLTQNQLAERINEPEAAVKMAEQGVVPEGYVLIDKLEDFFKIKLVKKRDLSLATQKQQTHLNQQLRAQEPVTQQKEENQESKSFVFDRNIFSTWTISDLKRMKEEEREMAEEHGQTRPSDRLDYE